MSNVQPVLGPEVTTKLSMLMEQEGYIGYDNMVMMLVDFYTQHKNCRESKRSGKSNKLFDVNLPDGSKTQPKVISPRTAKSRSLSPRLRFTIKGRGKEDQQRASLPALAATTSSRDSGSGSRLKSIRNSVKRDSKKMLTRGRSWSKSNNNTASSPKLSHESDSSGGSLSATPEAQRRWQQQMEDIEDNDADAMSEDDVLFLTGGDDSNISVDLRQLAVSPRLQQPADDAGDMVVAFREGDDGPELFLEMEDSSMVELGADSGLVELAQGDMVELGADSTLIELGNSEFLEQHDQ